MDLAGRAGAVLAAVEPGVHTPDPVTIGYSASA
jgi:hypothetical protein